MKFKTWQKNVLSTVFIIFVGFIFFNLAFMLAALIINVIMKIMGTPENSAPHFISWVIYFMLIILISVLVLKSKINTLFKAAFLTMPLMIIVVLIGMTFYQTKLIVTMIGAAFIGSVALFLYKKKLPWQYYVATLYVTVLGIFIMAFNIQI